MWPSCRMRHVSGWAFAREGTVTPLKKFTSRSSCSSGSSALSRARTSQSSDTLRRATGSVSATGATNGRRAARKEARRDALSTRDKVRAADQPEDGESPRTRNTYKFARTRGRGDRIESRVCSWLHKASVYVVQRHVRCWVETGSD
jgi:hypothetical protein